MLRYFPNKSEAAARDAAQCELVDEQMRAVCQAKEKTFAWARGAEWMRDGLHEVLFRIEALPKNGCLGFGLVATGFNLENQKGGLGDSSKDAWGFEFFANGVRVLEQGKEVFRKVDASCTLKRKSVILCTVEMVGGGAKTICCAVNNKDIGYSLKNAAGKACDGHSDRLALAISMSGAPAGDAQYDVHCLEYSVTWEATMGRLDTIGRAEKAMDDVQQMFRDMMRKDADPDLDSPRSADHVGKATAACNDVQSLLRQVAVPEDQKPSPGASKKPPEKPLRTESGRVKDPDAPPPSINVKVPQAAAAAEDEKYEANEDDAAKSPSDEEDMDAESMSRETMLSPRQKGLAELLEKCHLSNYMKSLRRSGYIELGDIREADESDLVEIGLKKPEAKRLRRYLRDRMDE